MMEKCWLTDLGGCSDKISLEHYVSKAFFEQDEVVVYGFTWTEKKGRTVSLAKLGIKNLCTFHNNLLGERVDLEGVRLSRYLRNPVSREKLVIKGYLFEQWLLKTAVNLCMNSGFTLGVGMALGRSKIAYYLQEVALGRRVFSHRMGLYFLPSTSSVSIENSVFSAIPIIKNDEIGGVYFNIYGIGIFLSLFPGHAPSILKQLGITDGVPKEHLSIAPYYRPSRLILVHNDFERVLEIDWL